MTRRLLLASTMVLLIVVAAAWGIGTRRRVAVTRARNASARAPVGARVRVEVLNGTTTRGLARRATEVLRDRGFDVLADGTSPTQADTSVVLDLTGHPDWAGRVAAVFAPARVESRPDSSRDLDVSVVIGASWRPPAEPFYP